MEKGYYYIDIEYRKEKKEKKIEKEKSSTATGKKIKIMIRTTSSYFVQQHSMMYCRRNKERA